MNADGWKKSLAYGLFFAAGFGLTQLLIPELDTKQLPRHGNDGASVEEPATRHQVLDTASEKTIPNTPRFDNRTAVEYAARTAGQFAFSAIFSDWARSEPDEALKWIQQHQYLLERSPEIPKIVAQAIIDSRANIFDAIASIYPSYQSALIRETAFLVPQRNLAFLAEDFTRRGTPPMIATLARAWGERDAESALAWLAEAELEHSRYEAMVDEVMLGLSAVDPVTALEWSLQPTTTNGDRLAKEIFRNAVRAFGAEATTEIALELLSGNDQRLGSLVDAARADLIRQDPVNALSLGFKYGSEITRNVTLCAAYDAAPYQTKRWLSQPDNARAAHSVLLGLAIQEATKGATDAMDLLQFVEETERPQIARQIVYSWRPLLAVSDIRAQIASSPFLDANAKALLAASADRPLLGMESRWLASKDSSIAKHP